MELLYSLVQRELLQELIIFEIRDALICFSFSEVKLRKFLVVLAAELLHLCDKFHTVICSLNGYLLRTDLKLGHVGD